LFLAPELSSFPDGKGRFRMTISTTDGLLFGYHMPSFTFTNTAPEELFDRVAANAQAAESAGFDLVTVMDHFYQIRVVGPEEEPMLEAYTTLAALAARTNRVRLATMVTGVTYRNPALLAKEVTTLDVISKGRAILGIGAAWNESEHEGLGFEYPPIKERMDRLEEALEICHLMFTEERPTFSGRYFRIAQALNSPRPIQPGGPPILIGGSGERRTLRMVAKYADISNWFGPIDEMQHKLDVLERHCEEVGRDPTTILRTVMLPVVLAANQREAAAIQDRLPPERRAQVSPVTPEEAAELIGRYRDLGFRGFVFRNAGGLMNPQGIGLAGEAIRMVRSEAAVPA
jgi:F420-dependent oxidoreductase-like protein